MLPHATLGKSYAMGSELLNNDDQASGIFYANEQSIVRV